MLNSQKNSKPFSKAKQSGVVLVLALIVLIALTLAGLVLMRSVGTANIIAGNLAFKQAATLAAERGIETAISWIENNEALLIENHRTDGNGYSASALTDYASSDADSWNTLTSNPDRTPVLVLNSNGNERDGAGNRVEYVIDRLCEGTGAPNTGTPCAESPAVNSATGNSEEAGEIPIEGLSSVYYRITVRVTGPRNTQSIVQTIVAR